MERPDNTRIAQTSAAPRTSRQAAKAQRREAIVTAATRLFASEGFASVSITEVGAGAGVSGPAVYRHFDSKEALLSELLVGISQRLSDRADSIVDQAQRTGEDARLTLRALIDYHLTFTTREPELIRIQDRDLSALPPDARRTVRRLQRSYIQRWVSVVRAVHPTLSEAQATVRVQAVFGLLNSTHYVTGRQPVDVIEDQLRQAARASLGV